MAPVGLASMTEVARIAGRRFVAARDTEFAAVLGPG
jgi:hypothetical protein